MPDLNLSVRQTLWQIDSGVDARLKTVSGIFPESLTLRLCLA